MEIWQRKRDRQRRGGEKHWFPLEGRKGSWTAAGRGAPAEMQGIRLATCVPARFQGTGQEVRLSFQKRQEGARQTLAFTKQE